MRSVTLKLNYNAAAKGLLHINRYYLFSALLEGKGVYTVHVSLVCSTMIHVNDSHVYSCMNYSSLQIPLIRTDSESVCVSSHPHVDNLNNTVRKIYNAYCRIMYLHRYCYCSNDPIPLKRHHSSSFEPTSVSEQRSLTSKAIHPPASQKPIKCFPFSPVA